MTTPTTTRTGGHPVPDTPATPMTMPHVQLRMALHNLLLAYRHDGIMPTEALQLVLRLPPDVADAALARPLPGEDPLTTLRRTIAERTS